MGATTLPNDNDNKEDLNAELRCDAEHLKRFHVAAASREFQSVAPTVERFCNANHIPEAVSNRMNLALDEVLSNIAKYAYDTPEPAIIEVELTCSTDNFMATVRDAGRPFNPLLFSRPANSGAIEVRKQGELGILFVQRVTDSVVYDRSSDRNKLTLTIKLVS